MKIKKGDVYYLNLETGIGSEQNGERPVLILQNDIGNHYSSTTVVASITTSTTKKPLPTHVHLLREENGLPENSIIMLEQIFTIDKSRLGRFVCHLSIFSLSSVNEAIKCSLGLTTEDIVFRCDNHRETFEIFLKNHRVTNSNRYLSALFLVTSDKRLWRKIKSKVTEKDIKINEIDLRGLSEYENYLLKAACDILYGSSYFAMTDMNNPSMFGSSTFEVLLQALRLYRYGIK